MGRKTVLTLDFTKGLNEFFESSSLPEGYAKELRNWVPEENGSLRVPRGWESASASSLTNTRSARGLGYYVPAGGARYIVAQASDATHYKLWALAKGNLTSGAWSNFDNLTVADSGKLVAFASGVGVLLSAATSYPSAYIRYWNGSSAGNALTTALAGRALIYHNNRFFSGGSDSEPTIQRWSDLGSYTSWTTGTNFQPIGQEDGEPIEDFCSFDRSLFIGKEGSIWYMTGFGPDTFTWRKIDGGGVAPGRTLVPTPSGIIAIGRERVYNFTGGGFEPISQPIENSYGLTGDFMTGCYIDGVVYICDGGSGQMWRYDTRLQSWATQDCDDAVEGPNVIFTQGSYLLAGTMQASANSILLYRGEPGGTRQMPENTGVTYTASTGDMFLTGPSRPYSVMQLDLILRQRGGDETETPITLNVYDELGDVTLTKEIGPYPGTGVYRERVGIGRSGKFASRFELTQSLLASETSQFDVEVATLEIEEEELR